MSFTNKHNRKTEFLKTQTYLNPISKDIFFTIKSKVFLYNCKETHEMRNTKNLNKRY